MKTALLNRYRAAGWTLQEFLLGNGPTVSIKSPRLKSGFCIDGYLNDLTEEDMLISESCDYVDQRANAVANRSALYNAFYEELARNPNATTVNLRVKLPT
jgi:hypothetical protein